MLQEVVDKAPDHTALAMKRNGEWVKWTYREYKEDVRTVAKAFIKLGLKPDGPSPNGTYSVTSPDVTIWDKLLQVGMQRHISFISFFISL